jgi:hypothetical protein
MRTIAMAFAGLAGLALAMPALVMAQAPDLDESRRKLSILDDELDRKLRTMIGQELERTEKELAQVNEKLKALDASNLETGDRDRERRQLQARKTELEKAIREWREIRRDATRDRVLRAKEQRPPPRFEVGIFSGGAIVLGVTPGVPTNLFHFDQSEVDKLPAGWQAAHTGRGEGSIWKVVADKTAPSKSGYALAQTAESPGAFFNLCVCEKATAKDVELQVAFKAVKGKADQGGGLVWRYQDADNYYIARMNPLEDNFRVYKVIAGKRIQLGTKEGLKVPGGEWHTLAIKHVGDKIECTLDGTKYLDATDSAITEAGKVGLWTKADAQTYFDGLKMTDLGQ